MKMEAVRTLLEEVVYNVCDNAIKVTGMKEV